MKKTLYLCLMVLFTMTINLNAKDFLIEFVKAHPDLNSSKMITLLSEGKNEANASGLSEEKFYKYLGFAYSKLTKRTNRKLSKNVPNFLANLDKSNLEFGGLSEYFKAKKETAIEKKETADGKIILNISKSI